MGRSVEQYRESGESIRLADRQLPGAVQAAVEIEGFMIAPSEQAVGTGGKIGRGEDCRGIEVGISIVAANEPGVRWKMPQ